jgi:hypothetical protein
MIRKANYEDNAVAESFFATLEKELLDDEVFLTGHMRDSARPIALKTTIAADGDILILIMSPGSNMKSMLLLRH